MRLAAPIVVQRLQCMNNCSLLSYPAAKAKGSSPQDPPANRAALAQQSPTATTFPSGSCPALPLFLFKALSPPPKQAHGAYALDAPPFMRLTTV